MNLECFCLGEFGYLSNFAVDYPNSETEMEIIRKVDELKNRMAAIAAEGKSVGLVPTMGALHQGHMSLITRARNENDVVVASVFVNPTQFNNPDDLRTYPRTEEADCEKLAAHGCDIAFIPSVEEIYPEPDTRVFDLGEVADVMEGAHRPGHFNGVAQIVSRLFEMVSPTRAYFGEKDFQQIAVIKRMVQLEGFDIDIVDCPIVREPDGLAMSSRNTRLSASQRRIAPAIHLTLEESVKRASALTVTQLKKLVVDTIDSQPELKTEYFEIVNPVTMQPIENWADCADPVGCITVYCGDVRLIDNIKYESSK